MDTQLSSLQERKMSCTDLQSCTCLVSISKTVCHPADIGADHARIAEAACDRFDIPTNGNKPA